ncbi:hypothetical protein ACHAWO_009993 [Cyclotella atomus]|uniref:Uncharacterized protein n=1 Tax=Cyclotella atomus TaxID=382360 RepID=A0ABD3QHL2_9STRA
MVGVGLVHIRHDDVADEFGNLCELAFSKGQVTHDPRINASGKLNDEGDDLKDVPPVEDARADANATHSSYKESNEN